MFKMKKYLLLCAALFFTNFAQAADIYPLDPDHTNITWSANHFGFSSPSGKFTQAKGYIIIDETRPQNSAVSVTIKTDSLITGIANFDSRLKGKDFLNTAKYPEATFASKNVIVQGNNARVTGDFTLLGIAKEITLNVHLNRIGLNSYTQKKTVGFSANTTIKRSDFGMDFGIPGISDNVKINIEVEGILDKNAKTDSDKNENKSLIKEDLFNNNTYWKVDAQTSSIFFNTMQNNSSVSGSFKNFEGKIIFNPQDLEGSAVSVDIYMPSITCSINDAIEVLKTTEWLNLAQFTRANFTATRFSRTNIPNQFIAKGTLTLKGRSLPADLTFNLLRYSDIAATATGSVTIKRSDFGIGNPNPAKANGVQDDVQIKFTVNAKK